MREPDCLKRRAREIEAEAGFLRRHEELVDWAVSELEVDPAFAERVYDIAREERIEPAYAFELVRCGAGIRAEVARAGAAPSLDAREPSWIADSPDPESALREWRLRVSLRRLRALMEECETPTDALVRFAEAPDVDAAGY
ncbi:MAG: hypothetical protein ACRELV_05910 [Longimicrobiales bacterium]